MLGWCAEQPFETLPVRDFATVAPTYLDVDALTIEAAPNARVLGAAVDLRAAPIRVADTVEDVGRSGEVPTESGRAPCQGASRAPVTGAAPERSGEPKVRDPLDSQIGAQFGFTTAIAVPATGISAGDQEHDSERNKWPSRHADKPNQLKRWPPRVCGAALARRRSPAARR